MDADYDKIVDEQERDPNGTGRLVSEIAAQETAPKAGYITVRVVDFGKGLRYVKQWQGKYNPTTKTWTVPTHRNGIPNNALNAVRAYGCEIVK